MTTYALLKKGFAPVVTAAAILLLVGCGSSGSESETAATPLKTSTTVEEVLSRFDPLWELNDPANPPCWDLLSDPIQHRCATAEQAARMNCEIERHRDWQKLLHVEELFKAARFYDDFDMLRDYTFDPQRFPVDCTDEPVEPEKSIDVGGTPR